MTKEIAFEIAEFDGIVRSIRHPRNKKMIKEICLKKQKYRKNNVYGTYNSIADNKILYYKDARKIRICK